MSKETGEKKAMPKGGRKGGTQFPQINLADADKYSRKLASKTHNGPQPESVILPGVFDSATSKGKIRASGMKQYGLMQGEAAAYEATQLAKNLIAAPPEEKASHLRQAFLNAKVFKTLYDTFVGDTVSLAKLRQQAAQLQVHPDNQEMCVKLFVDSAVTAGLATQNGENLALLRIEGATSPAGKAEPPPSAEDSPASEENDSDGGFGQDGPNPPGPNGINGGMTGRAVINVNVTLDSSLDTEKLEKQLKLLRRYGAI